MSCHAREGEPFLVVKRVRGATAEFPVAAQKTYTWNRAHDPVGATAFNMVADAFSFVVVERLCAIEPPEEIMVACLQEDRLRVAVGNGNTEGCVRCCVCNYNEGVGLHF